MMNKIAPASAEEFLGGLRDQTRAGHGGGLRYRLRNCRNAFKARRPRCDLRHIPIAAGRGAEQHFTGTRNAR